MSARSVLLVEGSDDQHVVYALCQRHQLPETFDVKNCENVQKVIERLVLLKAQRGELDRIGVVLDADADVAARWASVRDRLRQLENVELPAEPDPAGTVVTLEDDRRFGAWVMPDNRVPGMLEDFLATLRPADDTLLPLVDAFLEGLPDRDQCPQRFREVHRPKARIHTFLALQDEPGKPLGQAITARMLDATQPAAAPFVAWLRRLFVE